MGIVTNKKENKKITEEELKELKEIQSQTKGIVLELGEIEVIKLQLKKREDQAQTFFNKLLEKEETFTKNILDKYGTIEIHPETGKINKDV